MKRDTRTPLDDWSEKNKLVKTFSFSLFIFLFLHIFDFFLPSTFLHFELFKSFAVISCKVQLDAPG